jgi:hypothetical protein
VTVTALALLLTGTLAGCSEDDPVTPGPTLRVERNDYGKRWPLTVDSGVLRCTDGAVTLQTEDGKVYALNAPARRAELGRQVAEVWADDPEAPGSKKEIGLLVAAGLSLCRQGTTSASPTASPSAS